MQLKRKDRKQQTGTPIKAATLKVRKKQLQEKQTIRLMMELYCRKHHGKTWCKECAELYVYACERIDCCPFVETKTFCSSCHVHCYKQEQQAKIQEIMRFSGPRMLLYHPRMAVAHMFDTVKYKYQNK